MGTIGKLLLILIISSASCLLSFVMLLFLSGQLNDQNSFNIYMVFVFFLGFATGFYIGYKLVVGKVRDKKIIAYLSGAFSGALFVFLYYAGIGLTGLLISVYS